MLHLHFHISRNVLLVNGSSDVFPLRLFLHGTSKVTGTSRAARPAHTGGRGGGFRGGGPGMRTAKVLASGDLQLIILLLLSNKPSHGYEVIKAVEEQSSGVYTPSPGMVYPALTYLEEMGYAAAAAEGTKKLYSITAEGTAHLNEHRAAATEVWDQLAIFGRKLAHFQEQFAEDEDVVDHFGFGQSGEAPDGVAGNESRIPRPCEKSSCWDPRKTHTPRCRRRGGVLEDSTAHGRGDPRQNNMARKPKSNNAASRRRPAIALHELSEVRRGVPGVPQFTIVLDFMVLSPLGALVIPALRIPPAQFGLIVSAYAFQRRPWPVSFGWVRRPLRAEEAAAVLLPPDFWQARSLCGVASGSSLACCSHRMVTGVFAGVVGSIRFCALRN